METPLDLPQLVAGATAGQAEALALIYTAYAAAIRRYCYGRVGDVEVAADCTQDVFVRVCQRITTFEYRGERAFLAWLFRIARNVTADTPALRVPEPLAETVIDPRSHDLDERACQRVLLRAALVQLTADQQQVLYLRFVRGYSGQATAVLMQRSEGAVRVLQHRALQRLQHLMSDATPQADTTGGAGVVPHTIPHYERTR